MKLYYATGACSLAAHACQKEAGLPHELIRVDLRTHKTEAGDDFYTINPKGYVPALALDDGSILTENPAILQYIADQVPEKGLAPANGTMERYRLQEWLGFIGSEIHKLFGPLFRAGCTEEVRKAQHERIADRLDYVSKALEKRPFLLGDRFTVADAYLFAVLSWTRMTGPELAKWPAIQAYVQRVAEQPGVRAAMQAEGLLK